MKEEEESVSIQAKIEFCQLAHFLHLYKVRAKERVPYGRSQWHEVNKNI